jgi:hypothetical protein
MERNPLEQMALFTACGIKSTLDFCLENSYFACNAGKGISLRAVHGIVLPLERLRYFVTSL